MKNIREIVNRKLKSNENYNIRFKYWTYRKGIQILDLIRKGISDITAIFLLNHENIIYKIISVRNLTFILPMEIYSIYFNKNSKNDYVIWSETERKLSLNQLTWISEWKWSHHTILIVTINLFLSVKIKINKNNCFIVSCHCVQYFLT